MASDPSVEWAVTWGRYVSTVRYGGTGEQRRWAFGLAMKALDGLMAFEAAELAARSKRDTTEMEAA